MHEGIVTKKCSNSAYKVNTGDYQRIYNQSHLKSIIQAEMVTNHGTMNYIYNESAAKSKSNYDAGTSCRSSSLENVGKSIDKRYFLHKKHIDPKVYKT